ncbi:MAG: amino acid permease [Candidatus Aminicenantes bacterium]|jgi:amino acid transporter/nucleotide-binding universal stress UspA family protein
MDENKTQISAELSRELTLFHITMMGLGMMIGAGVFIGIGNAIFMAGPGGVLLTFSLNGVIAILTALSYAELSSAIPRAGGAYNFARLAFGRGTSFVGGWMEWFASSVAGSLYAVTFAIYTVRYFEGLGLLGWFPFSTRITEKVVAFFVAGFFIYINYRGASETGRIGAFFTMGQTLFLIFIGIVGLIVVLRDPSRLQNLSPFLPHGWSKILITMGFTYVAFEGYEVIAQAGDETIDPKRNLPKAMLYSVGIVTFTYVAVAFASIIAVKSGSPGVEGAVWEWIGSFHERGFGEAVSRLLPFGNFLLTLAVIFASISALNATIYSATRASYALGRDRMLPKFFAGISRKRNTPWVALMFTGCIVIIVAVGLPTMDVASSASIMFLFLFFLVNLSVIKIRLNMGDELSYGFIMPLFPWLPIAAIICQAVLAVWLVHMSPLAWIIAPIWIFSGIGIYFFYSRSRTVTTAEEIYVLEEEQIAPEGKQYSITLAVANPANALELARTTYFLSEAKKAKVRLLHMVPVPEQTPLSDAEKFMMEGKEGIVEAMLCLVLKFPITTTIRYCRNIARGIIGSVKEKKTDMLILGWHGKPKGPLFRLGSTLDVVMERAPCNVAVLKGLGNQKFKRILVPMRGGPNSALALEIASILAEKDDAEVVSFAVKSKKSRIDADKVTDTITERSNVNPERIKMKLVKANNAAEAILNESKDYDLIVLGFTRDPLIRQITKETVCHAVAWKCNKPMIIVKAPGRIGSWLKRWL